MQSTRTRMSRKAIAAGIATALLIGGIGQLVGEYKTSWNQLMAGSFFALIPMALIFVFFNRYLVSGLTAGAVKE